MKPLNCQLALYTFSLVSQLHVLEVHDSLSPFQCHSQLRKDRVTSSFLLCFSETRLIIKFLDTKRASQMSDSICRWKHMEGSHTFTLHPFYPATQGSFSRRPPRMVSAAYVLEEKANYNHEYDKNKNGFESYSQRVQKFGASKGEDDSYLVSRPGQKVCKRHAFPVSNDAERVRTWIVHFTPKPPPEVSVCFRKPGIQSKALNARNLS